jgi:hypothetical protein
MKSRKSDAANRRLRGTYDEFFSASTRPTRVQSWGLVLLGGNLVVLGVALLWVLVSKIGGVSLDPTNALILLLGLGVSGLIMYFGFVHVKRALVGRNCKPRT